MARARTELHEILCDILGSRNVYFQPPSTVKMKYDGIVYSYNPQNDVKHADDIRYLNTKRYSVIAISKDPDSELQEKILSIPYTELDQVYTSDNLNHWVFTLYF